MQEPRQRDEIIEALFRQYGNAIYRFVKYSLPDDVDAADVVQDVFIQAFRAWPKFEGKSDVKTWLFTIARNRVYDVLRKKRNERKYLLTRRTSSIHTSQLDTIVELEDALSRLGPADQQVLNLRLIQDLSVPETSRILGWTEMKVRVRFHRARKTLQYVLTEPNVGENASRKGGSQYETHK